VLPKCAYTCGTNVIDKLSQFDTRFVMAKPSARDEIVQINLRIPSDLIDLLDKLVDLERAARPGSSVSRSDVIRDALYQVARERLGSKKGSSR
jgi:hypothetical protein